MKALVAAVLALAAIGCGGKCFHPEDCDPGFRCDPIDRICVKGCATDDDCFSKHCDLEKRLCLPKDVPFPDASTSSTADAG